MLRQNQIQGMREILDQAYKTPAREIASSLLGEVVDLIGLLGALKEGKRCFCSMPVHLKACEEALAWLECFHKQDETDILS